MARYPSLRHNHGRTQGGITDLYPHPANAKIGLNNAQYAAKSQIPLRYLVADRSKAGRRPAVSWKLAYQLAS